MGQDFFSTLPNLILEQAEDTMTNPFPLCIENTQNSFITHEKLLSQERILNKSYVVPGFQPKLNWASVVMLTLL